MSLVAIGINHNTAPVAIREKVSFSPEAMSESLLAIQSLPGINEVVILSTCNRSELYCDVELPAEAVETLTQWLANRHSVDDKQLASCLYVQKDSDAVSHVSRVASGLDSMVLGEPQILGQLKSAYAVAREYETVGPMLNYLFQHSFKAAKKVRTETAIGENAVSVAYAAVSLSTRIFTDLKECRALLVGAGETIDLVARHLRDKGVHQITVANRTLARAEVLAEQFDAKACLLADIPDELPKADIVITSTASQLPLIGKGMVERALKLRKYKPVFMVDIAVPRDIESEVSRLRDVFLYTVDDLKDVIEGNRRSREKAAVQAHEIIGQLTEEFMKGINVRGAGSVIKSIRNQANEIKQAELARAERALAAGADPSQVIAQLAHNITNKLMHNPTVALRDAHENGQPDAGEWAQRLFDIKK
ncbi:glutamyl-tRNA reductase [Reinekea marinisedimentorum]|uniref:Glutamyl-tRNA reductase n=1 Tax=Reinekea marinisedimentorum TaxID=230495 RepID=A0A4R3I6S6_9GAMM|nr:glutamyl-tRNA reductase [Reinekea marinisedimentorum]TCS41393.1 glutamyl-tRNA reductase [Reinekea marinisedimentorum]